MCTCSMRSACKPGSDVPEHLNLSRTPAPYKKTFCPALSFTKAAVQFLNTPRRREAARFIGAGCLLGRTGL